MKIIAEEVKGKNEINLQIQADGTPAEILGEYTRIVCFLMKDGFESIIREFKKDSEEVRRGLLNGAMFLINERATRNLDERKISKKEMRELKRNAAVAKALSFIGVEM